MLLFVAKPALSTALDFVTRELLKNVLFTVKNFQFFEVRIIKLVRI